MPERAVVRHRQTKRSSARTTIILLGAFQQPFVAQGMLLKSKMMVSQLPDHHLAPISGMR
jgi:hypothetical protein